MSITLPIQLFIFETDESLPMEISANQYLSIGKFKINWTEDIKCSLPNWIHCTHKQQEEKKEKRIRVEINGEPHL